jgi:hypothetical protein
MEGIDLDPLLEDLNRAAAHAHPHEAPRGVAASSGARIFIANRRKSSTRACRSRILPCRPALQRVGRRAIPGGAQIFLSCAACFPLPLRSSASSKVTLPPSFSARTPAASSAVARTNTSLPPPSGSINPNPFAVLKNFTVPVHQRLRYSLAVRGRSSVLLYHGQDL